TGLTTGMRHLISLTISHVRSTLPSSTTMISWRTLCNRSSTCRCSTVEAMQASSSRAGITTLSNVRGFLSIDFTRVPIIPDAVQRHWCSATDCPPYGAFFFVIRIVMLSGGQMMRRCGLECERSKIEWCASRREYETNPAWLFHCDDALFCELVCRGSF